MRRVPGVGCAPVWRGISNLGATGGFVHYSSRVSVIPSSFNLRWSAERSIPMKLAVREMLPEKRRIWMRRYSRSKRLARLAQRRSHDRVGAAAHIARIAQHLGRQQIEVDPADAVARRHDHGALDHVAELADIARPFIALQRDHGVRRDLRRRHAAFRGVMRDEMADQRRNVLAPLGEAGDQHGHDVEAVIEILAEAPFGDLVRQVARGGGDDADIDLDDSLAANAR